MTIRKRKRKESCDERKESCVSFSNTQDAHRNKILFAIVAAMLSMTAACAYFYVMISYCLTKNTHNNSDIAKQRVPNTRKTWGEEEKRYSPRMFFRLFRMKRSTFQQLALKIEKHHGEENFKSEAYLLKLKSLGNATAKSRMYNATRSCNTGDYISGERKLAITLRLMAGASYLDMYLWSNISANHINHIFQYTVEHWLCREYVSDVNFFNNVLFNETNARHIRNKFNTTSNGILSGCVGALDGWLVRIRCPTLSEVPNPGKYISRKGFFAINVQAIVDKDKRILWRHIGSLGSSHDSPVFKESFLARYLDEHVREIIRKGIYLVGDSAYALRPYLLVPFDNAKPQSKEDGFNYYLSKNRIYVECAFGEIDRRWGIFWKPLEGTLKRHTYTIDAAIRLHNFIVDHRLEEDDADKDMDEEYELNRLSDQHLQTNPDSLLGVYYEDEEEMVAPARLANRRGRPTNNESWMKEEGKDLRDKICNRLWTAGLRRKENATGCHDKHHRIVSN